MDGDLYAPLSCIRSYMKLLCATCLNPFRSALEYLCRSSIRKEIYSWHMADEDTLFRALMEVNKLYRPAGQPVVFDLQPDSAPSRRDIVHRPDITLQKAAIRISPLMTLQEMRYFITQFAEDTYRVKGILQLQEGVFLIDCVGPVLQISPCDCTPDDNNTLTALAGPRMPLRKSLIEALKWYPGKAEWMQ